MDLIKHYAHTVRVTEFEEIRNKWKQEQTQHNLQMKIFHSLAPAASLSRAHFFQAVHYVILNTAVLTDATVPLSFLHLNE
jgi:hypothetical protein